MEDTSGVAVLDSIKDLKENSSSLVVVSNVVAILSDLGEQVALRTVLQNNESAVGRVQDLLHRNHVGVATGTEVQLNFSILECPLPRVKSKFVQGLDGVLHVRFHIPSLVDSPVGTNSKNISQLEPISENLA